MPVNTGVPFKDNKMSKEKSRQAVIDEALLMIANKSNPTVVEIAERVKRKYYI